MLEVLQHQRDETTEKHGQRNYGSNIGTKKRNTSITKLAKHEWEWVGVS